MAGGQAMPGPAAPATPASKGPGGSSEPGFQALREAPVMPALEGEVLSEALTARAAGERLGNRRDVFAMAGDSITCVPLFLTELAGREPEWGEWGELRETAEYFGRRELPANFTAATEGRSNSFSRTSLAAIPFWVTSHAVGTIDSISTTRERTLARPFEAELRLMRPSIALVMFGTNDLALGHLEPFRRNLGRLVEVAKGLGVIAVLSTVPPRADGEPFVTNSYRFNTEIVEVARDWRTPLWNYWRQLVEGPAPDQGLDPDGIHPSAPTPPGSTVDFTPDGLRYGFNQRNLGALRVLDRLRTDVLER